MKITKTYPQAPPIYHLELTKEELDDLEAGLREGVASYQRSIENMWAPVYVSRLWSLIRQIDSAR